MYISKREYVKPLIKGTGLTTGNKYLVIDGGFSGGGAYIQDDDGISHYLSDDFLLNNCECTYKYVIHEGRKVTECDRIRIDKRLIDKYIIDSLFDFRGYTDDDKTALKRILSDIENAHILNWSMSRYAEKVYKQLETEV